MPGKPSPNAERIMALAVGKSCVIRAADPRSLAGTVRKHFPGRKFTMTAVDGQHVVRRTA